MGEQQVFPPPFLEEETRHPIIRKKDYLQTGQHFAWATYEHYVLWFTGRLRRHKRTEVILPRLVKEGRLVAVRHGKRLVYSVPRRCQGKKYPDIEHGLGCTEGLVRFWLSQNDGIILPERAFRGLGVVPEWGILYPNGRLLLYEYGTPDNFYLTKGKVTGYRSRIYAVEERFHAEAFVVFVLSAGRDALKRYMRTFMPTGWRYTFTDLETFISVPYGQQLTAPIYICGQDGIAHPLVEKSEV